MIGRTLGHFEILSLLGQGGMGAVYKAHDTHLERMVALKVLPHDKMADPDRKRRFAQEAKAASALNHPNIITIYDISTDDGVDYIAMEYVEGRTLADLLKNGALPLREAIKYARQMADALAAAHAAGILHRDLKPANIMVKDTGLVKVLDFGLAKLTDPGNPSEDSATRTIKDETRAGTVMGTVAYMSPEQAEGRKLDFRSDIFSFGAVLYEMASGHRAFEGESYASLLAAVLRDDPKPLAQVRPEAPDDLAQIIAQCVKKHPQDRFSSMKAVATALENVSTEPTTIRIAAVPPMPPPLAPLAVPPPISEVVVPKKRSRRVKAWWLIFALVFGIRPLINELRQEVSDDEKKSSPRPAVATLEAIPLTGNSGIEEYPDFSPDGERVVYDWNGPREDNYDIYVKAVGPGAPLRLTSGPAPDYSPKWSPDGKQIAFLREAKPGTVLVLIPAEGGAERIVGQDRVGIRSFSWTPDSQHFVVAKRTEVGGILFLWSTASGDKVRLTSPAPGTSGAGDRTPAVSPDGKAVAFGRGISSSVIDLYLLHLSPDLTPSGEPVRFASANGNLSGIAWMPDGDELLYSAGTNDGTGSLWRTETDPGAKPRRVEQAGVGISQATVARQGDRLVYSHSQIDRNIWQIDVGAGKTTEPVRVVSSTRLDYEVRSSPDGRKIAFTSDRSGVNEIWIAEADGTNQIQLTHTTGSANTSAARFSPDGRQLVFISTKLGQSEIFTVPVEGGEPVRITNNPAHDTAPSWSADGKWIYFASNRGGQFDVWKTPASGGDAVQVTQNGGYASLASLDGKYIYYNKQTTPPAVWRAALDGSGEVQVIPGIDSWGNFAVTEKGIYFVPPEEGAIRFYDFATKNTSTVRKIDKQLDFGLTATPDGKRVLYTQIDRQTSELLLVEKFR